ARQLIDLAIHGGGPDNITCIVADVVDTATTRLPLTTAPVLAGAAASLGDLRMADGTGPFGIVEDHHEDNVRAARTAPQPAVADLDPMMTAAVIPVPVSENGADPRLTRARRSHRAQPRRSRGSRPRRRRWPIVTTALVVLLAVVVGGGYIFYRVSQEQYYVAANRSGQVVIYRGISQHIAGFSWSSPFEMTGIELAQVPSNYQQTVKTAYSTGSLTQVRSTVTNIRTAVDTCRNAYAALQTWATAVNNYNTELTQAHKARKPTNKIPKPPASPAPAGATCPSPAKFGIPASALAPALPGSS
ncbi:MAG: hypothetical protein ACRDOB_03265, partial [Streptosporangiaceae bacterium]